MNEDAKYWKVSSHSHITVFRRHWPLAPACRFLGRTIFNLGSQLDMQTQDDSQLTAESSTCSQLRVMWPAQSSELDMFSPCCELYMLTLQSFTWWQLRALHDECSELYLMTAQSFTRWQLRALHDESSELYMLEPKIVNARLQHLVLHHHLLREHYHQHLELSQCSTETASVFLDITNARYHPSSILKSLIFKVATRKNTYRKLFAKSFLI